MFNKKIEDAYKLQMFPRYDDMGFIKYFSKEDFDGLLAKPYSFKSSHGHMLKGYFYNYPTHDENRLIIFDHGLGGGHKSYMKEIEILCSIGFSVFAYDHTGCMESEGKDAGGFSQSLCDLDDCIKALKSDTDINTSDISVVGHSWGGYATLNILSLHPDIKRIVAISGFISVKRMIKQILSGIGVLCRHSIMKLEKSLNPKYVQYDAIKTLKHTNAKALLIYSDNDQMVKKEYHYDVLYKAFANYDNIEFLLTSGKGHNPNYTTDAVAYLATLTPAIQQASLKTEEEKETFKKSFDWDKMTSQDETVWQKIKNFLE